MSWDACLDPSRAFGSARETTSTLPLLRQICSLGFFPIHLDLGAFSDLVRDADISQAALSRFRSDHLLSFILSCSIWLAFSICRKRMVASPGFLGLLLASASEVEDGFHQHGSSIILDYFPQQVGVGTQPSH